MFNAMDVVKTYIGDAVVPGLFYTTFRYERYPDPEKRTKAFVRHVTAMSKCLAFLIKLVGTHKNGVIIGESKTAIAKRIRGISINTSLSYFNSLISLGFIKLIKVKNGKQYFFAQLPTHFRSEKNVIKSKEKFAIEFTEDTPISSIAFQISAAVFSMHVSKATYVAERVFKAAVRLVNNPKRNFKFGKKLVESIGDELAGSLLYDIRKVISNGHVDLDDRYNVDVTKPNGNWKFNLLRWLKRYLSRQFASRSYNYFYVTFGFSRKKISKVIKYLRSRGIVRSQRNYVEIDYSEFLELEETRKAFTFSATIGNREGFFKRTASSYCIMGSMRTELKDAGEKFDEEGNLRSQFLRVIMTKHFRMEHPDYRPDAIKRLRNSRYFYFKQHPELSKKRA